MVEDKQKQNQELCCVECPIGVKAKKKQCRNTFIQFVEKRSETHTEVDNDSDEGANNFLYYETFK